MFGSYPDLLRFYLLGGRLSNAPLIGRLIRLFLNQYGHIAHGGMALPLSEIDRVIDQASAIVAAECPCRALVDACDLPRGNCLKLNTAGEVLLEAGEKGHRISREEAKRIVAESHSRGMLLQLEWCINPFHYDICCCCACCCVARRLRFNHGAQGAIQAGPYVPRVDSGSCTGCMQCAAICPAGAIGSASEIRIAMTDCVGCGLCQSVCPVSAIELVPTRAVRRKNAPSSLSIFIWWLGAILVLVPAVMILKPFLRRVSVR